MGAPKEKKTTSLTTGKRAAEETKKVEPASKVPKKDEEPVQESADKNEEVAKPAEPEELEKDAPVEKRPAHTEPIAFDAANTTLNVVPAQGGRLLMALTDSAMQHFLAGARGNVGVKKGRYLYEVQVVEKLNPEEFAQHKKQSGHVLRVGVSLQKAELLQCRQSSDDDGEAFKGIYFEDNGVCWAGNTKTQSKKNANLLQGNCVIGILLNVDAKSPNNNTLSLFKDGVRVAGPVPLPEAIHGRSLFPHITFRNLTVRVHSGPEPLAPMPFKCRMWQGAAKDDISVEGSSASKNKDGKFEAVVPVGFPDEGTFDWLDGFLAKNPKYRELSDRMILDWAAKSGFSRKNQNNSNDCNDKPQLNFGVNSIDNRSVHKVINAIVTAVPRNYIVMEVCNNLQQGGRAEVLKRFPTQTYKRIAHVVMGEPNEEYKKKQHDITLKEKQAVIEKQWKVKKAQKAQKKLAEKKKKEFEKKQKEAKKKAEAARLKKQKEEERKKKEAAGETVEADDKTDEEPAKEEEPADEESEDEAMPQAELTEEEQKKCFRARPLPDLQPATLNKFFASFSIPEKSEGFDDIRFEWQDAAKSKKYLTSWVFDRKLTARVEDLKAGKWFTDKAESWKKKLQEWRTKQKEFKSKNPKKEEDDEKEDADIYSLEDVSDTGKGEPLFASFENEDWALVLLRIEFHLAINSFPKDCDDADRKIHESNLSFYYSRYWGKKFIAANYGLKDDKEIQRIIKDTVEIHGDTGVVGSKVDADLEAPDMFVKLAEESRRERQRRIDAGDDTSRLKFNASVLQSTELKAANQGGQGGSGKGGKKGR